MHRVSDHLNERHPYQDPPFKESYDPKDVTRAFGSRAVPKFAELLVMDDLNDDGRAKALAELHELLSNQETKYTAGTHEVLFSCADLTESRSPEVRKHAALVISSLVLYESDKTDDLSNETMLKAATTLLSDSDESVVVAACTIFRNLTISNEGVLLVAKRDDVVERITMVVTSQPVKLVPLPVLVLVIEILANLTRVFRGASVCMQFSVFTPVLEILKRAILYPPATILHAALVVSNAATHDQGKREAIEMGAVELCLKVLSKVLLAQSIKCPTDDAQVELIRTLIGAVMGLSTYEDAKPRVIEFGVEPLVACLKHKSASVRTNASIAVNSACESPLGATHFTTKLLADTAILVEVLGVRAIPALNKSIAGVDEDSKRCALDALAGLMKRKKKKLDDDDGDGDVAREVVQCLGMLDNLVELLMETQCEIYERAVHVLQQLAQSGSESLVRRIGKTMRKHGIAVDVFALVLGMTASDFGERHSYG